MSDLSDLLGWLHFRWCRCIACAISVVLTTMKPFLRTAFLALTLTALCVPATAQSVAVALSEMQTLANAEDVCALDTNFYVSLEALNDLSSTPDPASRDNVLSNGGTYAAETWRGPYDVGSPLDPWGTPYWFYSPLGLLRGDTGTATLEGYGDQFGRYTIVSYGLDGVKSADDLTYQFGPGLTSFVVTSLYGAWVTPPPVPNPGGAAWKVGSGNTITVRGINFGSTQGTGQVMLGSTELTGVTRWSNREIDVIIPVGLTVQAPLFITRGAQQSLAVQVDAAPPVAAVVDWQIY
jgi:hypothetical protein